jgi:tRNA_anti-like
MNKVIKWGAVGFGALTLLVILVPKPNTPMRKSLSKPAAPVPVAINVTAKGLFDAFAANEAAAQAKYAAGPMRVTGTIQAIEIDLFNKPVVRLVTGNQFLPATANLTTEAQKKAAALVKGAKVTLMCASVSEVIGAPQLAECAI